jgi:tetratricopeptide (TPR) repeat protein
MRRTLWFAAVTLSVILQAAPARPQAAQTGGQNTPQALKATYDRAMMAKDWPAAIAAAQQLVDSSATSQNLYLLGNAQLYATSGQSETGPMEAALATYDRALAAAEQEKPAKGQPDQAWKDGVAEIDIGRGNALLKLKRTPEAIDYYNRAAELSATPGKALFNICAVLYNTGDMANGPAACRKAAAADPTRANAWFILGSLLFANAPIDANRKVALSREGLDALKKYLELAPDGPHAADVKAMLDMCAQ